MWRLVERLRYWTFFYSANEKSKHMSSKLPHRSLALLLCVAILIALTGCRDEATGIYRIVPLRSPAPFAQTVSNVVDVLRMHGCSISMTNDVTIPAGEQHTSRIICFGSTKYTGTVKVEAQARGDTNQASVTYMINRERHGSENDMRYLSERLDGLEGENRDMH